MRPEPGQVLHFSEDPTITQFVPHVASSAQQREPYVWAVDHEHAPDYWFPRDCPRAMTWVGPATLDADRERIIGPGSSTRVHAIEYSWITRLLDIQLFAYRLPEAPFHLIGEPTPYAVVATEPVEPPSAPEPTGDLLHLHNAAGIQLRVLNNLWEFWHAVTTSTLKYSGIRLHNARPRP